MSTPASLTLGLFLATTALAHFVFPAYFRSLIPAWLPHPAIFVTGSALAELGTAALLFAPGTRAAGGWAAAGLLTAFLVPHVDAARHARARSGVLHGPWGVAARLAVNAGYIAWATAVAITA
ncbi:hypothetical protein [Streptomyces aureoverticillatus]|uniref:hypothetical protein n=1 Tax=Streptomyces aureoverticillatus TaxID=66871 RepID=UPI0013DBF03E|nr:hypothetical protein [Streptomyces aureoverticillatus]QIB47630.1 hypothetical protein G3H79_35725 [Streptomyces aureoverticillatus]